MTSTQDQISALATALGLSGPLKVWSVIVTILGDIAHQDPSAELPGPMLTDVMGHIGLQPEAVRVALHRLRQDGWIDSRKQGRTNHLRLSETGLQETRQVAARVFGSPADVSCDRIWVIAPPGASAWTEAGLDLGRGISLVSGKAVDIPATHLALADKAEALPDWAVTEIRARACDAEYRHLADTLGSLMPLPLPLPLSLTVAEQLALRTLVLHGWRRLVLKSDPVAERLLGEAAAARACRDVVLDLLARIANPLTGNQDDRA